jgi:hypothetical protein
LYFPWGPEHHPFLGGEKGKKMAKKPKKKAESSNQITELVTTDLISEVIDAVTAKRGYAKRDKFLMAWILGLPATTAGKIAGYSNSYASKLSEQVRKNPKLAERLEEITSVMPDRYRALCKFRLTDVAEVEGAALQKMKEDPLLAIKNPALLKQAKQAAGVLTEPTGPTVNLNLGFLQQAMDAQIFGGKKLEYELGPPGSRMATVTIIDAEVADEKALPPPPTTVTPEMREIIKKDREVIPRDVKRVRFRK